MDSIIHMMNISLYTQAYAQPIFAYNYKSRHEQRLHMDL